MIIINVYWAHRLSTISLGPNEVFGWQCSAPNCQYFWYFSIFCWAVSKIFDSWINDFWLKYSSKNPQHKRLQSCRNTRNNLSNYYFLTSPYFKGIFNQVPNLWLLVTSVMGLFQYKDEEESNFIFMQYIHPFQHINSFIPPLN